MFAVFTMEKIFVIGAGSWGTTLAALLGAKGYSVHLWARRKELAEEINKTRENKQYLKGIKIPYTVTATNSVESVSDSNVVVVAVPSKFFRETIKLFSGHISNDPIVVHTIKGFEGATGRRISDVLSQELPDAKKVAVISGPNHSQEVARKIVSFGFSKAETAAIVSTVKHNYGRPDTHELRGSQRSAA